MILFSSELSKRRNKQDILLTLGYRGQLPLVLSLTVSPGTHWLRNGHSADSARNPKSFLSIFQTRSNHGALRKEFARSLCLPNAGGLLYQAKGNHTSQTGSLDRIQHISELHQPANLYLLYFGYSKQLGKLSGQGGFVKGSQRISELMDDKNFV